MTSFLTGKAELKDCIYHVKGSDISVIPAGVVPPNPSELLGHERMAQLIRDLKRYYDYVLLDAPPVSIVTDAAVLGNIADGVLLVVRSRYAQAETIRIAERKLRDVNVKIFGVIINRFHRENRNVESRYYDSYGYGSYGTKHIEKE